VEEPSLLLPMQRVVGGIQVENNLPRPRGMGVDKQTDQQIFDRLWCAFRSIVITDSVRT
jgi:hypothetical protein